MFTAAKDVIARINDAKIIKITRIIFHLIVNVLSILKIPVKLLLQ